ncbi:hypothetical protein [Luteimonas deserti]|uniref:Uncharacterized protein n=1 Tax=Luteimonas deserti TaxID=2752306 RepID=A0A7Z0QST3_9GAMM|nr:hypothetical protein [Luteimonas deserti]NYZ64108.1 hypothetical protein [Luteimonas deserti]
MAVTRAKATSLLSSTEMGLFDDSRANALRAHSDAQLARLITRARTARDRARDLEKRQRLALRTATGSKSGRAGQGNARSGEKAELLADILTRLESQQQTRTPQAKRGAPAKATGAATPAVKKTAKKAAKKASAGRAATKKTSAKKTASSPATTTQAASKKTTRARTGATDASRADKAPAKATSTSGRAAKASSPRAAGRNRAEGRPAESTSGRTGRGSAGSRGGAARGEGASATKPGGKRRISPERALANTRELLERQAQDAAQPKPWEGISAEGTAQQAPGFQSGQARSRALDLHAGEIRQTSIQGSISTRDRKNQGKRDHRSK